MHKNYLGHLPQDDPLYGYLLHDIQPQLGGPSGKAKYRVFHLSGSNDVYLYEDKYTGARIVCKFFMSGNIHDGEKAAKRLCKEYQNLRMIRDHGLTGYPHYVARPLGCNYSLNDMLALEYCEGEPLSSVITNAISYGDHGRLFHKLTALAYFLSTLHNRTAIDAGVDFNQDCDYMDRLIKKLLDINAIHRDEAGELYWLRDQWRGQSRMWEDRQVFVHGDATPENFMFGGNLGVIAFDMERSKYADRVFDVGRIAGELMHFFLRATRNKYAAEPFIGHFLWEYSCHFPDRNAAFRSITGRVPFHIGITLLRIARNGWVSHEHRRQLINEAKHCLRRY